MYAPYRDGLGFPFLPIALAAGSVVGSLIGRKKPKVTRADAVSAVRQVYLELLERDPFDPRDRDPGAEGYVNCLIEGWCDVDFVRTEVLKSQEYRDVQTKKAQAVYAPSASAAALPGLPAGLDVGRIFPYALVGVLLLSLLRR